MNINLTNPIFHDEAKALAHLEASRWPNGATCPHCGSDRVRKMEGKTQAGMFLCNDCREFDFRYNTREMTDGERAALAVKGMVGRRLTYRRPAIAA